MTTEIDATVCVTLPGTVELVRQRFNQEIEKKLCRFRRKNHWGTWVAELEVAAG